MQELIIISKVQELIIMSKVVTDLRKMNEYIKDMAEYKYYNR